MYEDKLKDIENKFKGNKNVGCLKLISKGAPIQYQTNLKKEEYISFEVHKRVTENSEISEIGYHQQEDGFILIGQTLTENDKKLLDKLIEDI